MKLAVCRRRSERLGFSVVVGLLLESMINIYTFLLKVCGENWLFVREAMSGWVFSLLCGFCRNQ